MHFGGSCKESHAPVYERSSEFVFGALGWNDLSSGPQRGFKYSLIFLWGGCSGDEGAFPG